MARVWPTSNMFRRATKVLYLQ